MKFNKSRATLTSFLGTFLIAACSSAAQSSPADSIVRIKGSAMPGSGVVVDAQGGKATIWTVAHVIGNADSDISVTERDGATATATLLKFDKNRDIAVLQINTKLPYNSIQTSNASREETGLVVIGYPNRFNTRQQKAKIQVSRGGVVYGSWPNSASNYNIAYKAATLPGMSGGGVFNARGELVAIHALKDIGETLVESCQGSLKEVGKIGMDCTNSSTTNDHANAYEKSNPTFYTVRLLGSRGITANRFQTPISSQTSLALDIPVLLDNFNKGKEKAYSYIAKSLPRSKSNDQLTQDQKLAALIYYNNNAGFGKHPASPVYKEFILNQNLNTNSEIDNLLVTQAARFGTESIDYKTTPYGSQAFEKLESDWWSQYGSRYKSACLASDAAPFWCEPDNLKSKNLAKNARQAFNLNSSFAKAKIANGTADADEYLLAAQGLTYLNKDPKQALEYALEAQMLGEQRAEQLINDIAQRIGDYDALVLSFYNKFFYQLEKSKGSKNSPYTIQLPIGNNLTAFKKSLLGCEVGREIQSSAPEQLKQTWQSTFNDFARTIDTACSNNNPSRDSSNSITEKTLDNKTEAQALKTLTQLGIEIPAEASIQMTMPTSIPGIVGEMATYSGPKSAKALYEEIVKKALQNGFKPTNGGAGRGAGNGCMSPGGMTMCAAYFSNETLGKGKKFFLMINSAPGMDGLMIQTNIAN